MAFLHPATGQLQLKLQILSLAIPFSCLFYILIFGRMKTGLRLLLKRWYAEGSYTAKVFEKPLQILKKGYYLSKGIVFLVLKNTFPE